MRVVIVTCLLMIAVSSWSQEELLNQCFVLVLDSELKSDLRAATFDLPFAAMRASKDNKKIVVPHYAFDLQATVSQDAHNDNVLIVKSLRSYEYGETLADNEIAFFVMAWPASHQPEGMGPMLASFPSTNGLKVTTTHLSFKETFELSDLMVSQLGLASNKIGPGSFKIGRFEVEY